MQICSNCYTAVQINKHLCNQSSNYERITADLTSVRYERKPSYATIKSILFVYQQKQMVHKGGYWLLRYAKRHLSGQSSVKQQAQGLKLHLSKIISQLVISKFC